MLIREMPKGIRLVELTQEKALELWEKFSAINGLFDDFQKGNFGVFINKLSSPDTVWFEREDGNGLLYLTSVIKGLSATGHILYWDKKLIGTEEFTLDVLRYLVEVIPLKKVNLYLPDFAKSAIRYAERLGFKYEGTIRRWSYSNGSLFDMKIFGMLSEEVMASGPKSIEGTKEGE